MYIASGFASRYLRKHISCKTEEDGGKHKTAIALTISSWTAREQSIPHFAECCRTLLESARLQWAPALMDVRLYCKMLHISAPRNPLRTHSTDTPSFPLLLPDGNCFMFSCFLSLSNEARYPSQRDLLSSRQSGCELDEAGPRGLALWHE